MYNNNGMDGSFISSRTAGREIEEFCAKNVVMSPGFLGCPNDGWWGLQIKLPGYWISSFHDDDRAGFIKGRFIQFRWNNNNYY